jgi:hypothetical protein
VAAGGAGGGASADGETVTVGPCRDWAWAFPKRVTVKIAATARIAIGVERAPLPEDLAIGRCYHDRQAPRK